MFDRFTEIRKYFFQNQSEMAKCLNITRQAISSIEQGKSKPSYDLLYILLNKYNINLNYLLDNKGNMLLSDDDKVNNNDMISQLQSQIATLQADNNKLQAQLDLLKSIIQSNSNK